MAYVFGDDDPRDAFAADGEPDAEQVAHRLSDLADEVGRLAGHDGPSWDDLDAAERADRIDAAEALIDFLASTRDPDDVARSYHDYRHAGGRDLAWSELPEDHRAIARELARLIIEWLEHEGELR